MDWQIFGTYLAAAAVAGATGVIFRPGPWYERLIKPTWTPPNRVFPLVWTALYVLMAYVAARLALLPGTAFIMALWALQIVLNAVWSGVFFGARRMGLGMAVIAMLWVVIAVFIVNTWPVDWLAALLMVPYLIWLSLASALNFWIWAKNPGASATD
ncbi:MAG: tryptophan-rich sensory protein TspO [Paracoccaceae bacterium]